jgi:RecA-family ATPase
LYFLALGEIMLVTGAPGTGKTLLEVELAAAVSTGRKLPGNPFTRKPAHVLIINYEDDPAKSLLPRLRVAGADLSKIRAVDFSKANIVLPDHWDAIEKEVARWKAELVIIDPFPAFFAANLSTNNDAHVRQAARPGVAIARKHNCALLLIRHTNKLQSGGAIAKGGGSIGFTGIARTEFLLAASEDIEQENARVLACVKTNLSKKPASRVFCIVESDGIPKIEWSVEVDITADQLAESRGPNTGRSAEKRDQAREIIESVLGDGQWHRQREVVAEMGKAEISERTWKAAKASLGKDAIQHRKGTKLEGGDWWWRLRKVAPLHPLHGCTVAPMVPDSDCTPIYNNNNKIEDEQCNRATVQESGGGCTVTHEDAALDADFNGSSIPEDAV